MTSGKKRSGGPTQTTAEREAAGRKRLPTVWLDTTVYAALDAYRRATGASVKEAVSEAIRRLR